MGRSGRLHRTLAEEPLNYLPPIAGEKFHDKDVSPRYLCFVKFFTSRTVFLLDGCGALLSAALLVFLARYDDAFGIPFPAFVGLAAVAAVFAMYSFTCHLFAGERWRTFLKVIALANLLYCVATLTTVFLFRETISTIAVFYFLLEIAVIATLATLELKLARKK